MAGPPAQAEALRHSIQRASHWFWWLAALSALNSLFAILHWRARITLGLGTTRLLDALVYFRPALAGHSAPPALYWLHATVVPTLLAGCCLLGWRAWQGSPRAFLSGSILLALDTSLFLPARLWVSIAIHLVVVFLLANGYRNSRQLRRIASAPPATGNPP